MTAAPLNATAGIPVVASARRASHPARMQTAVRKNWTEVIRANPAAARSGIRISPEATRAAKAGKTFHRSASATISSHPPAEAGTVAAADAPPLQTSSLIRFKPSGRTEPSTPGKTLFPFETGSEQPICDTGFIVVPDCRERQAEE